MKPVDQTTFGFPGGNCFSACVASLLGLNIEDVPYFMGWTEEEGKDWYERFAKWLALRGFYPINLRARAEEWAPQGFYILNAGSPRGDFSHSVVARGKEIVHDPHPSRSGLVRLETSEVTLIVPLDPELRRLTPTPGGSGHE